MEETFLLRMLLFIINAGDVAAAVMRVSFEWPLLRILFGNSMGMNLVIKF